MGRSKINLRKQVISEIAEKVFQGGGFENPLAPKLDLSVNASPAALRVLGVAVAISRAEEKAFEAHGLDKENRSHGRMLRGLMALELYGRLSAGRPPHDKKLVAAFEEEVATEIDRLQLQGHGTRLDCCRILRNLRRGDPRFQSVETLRKQDLRARKRRTLKQH